MLRESVLSRGTFGNLDAIEDPARRRMMKGAMELFGNFAAAPVLIVPCLVSVESPAPEGLLAGSSIYPSVQNLLLAARAEGLGTVMTTPQAGIIETLRAELRIPDHARPVAMIPLGYPAVRFGPVNRRPTDEFIHWDGWSALWVSCDLAEAAQLPDGSWLRSPIAAAAAGRTFASAPPGRFLWAAYARATSSRNGTIGISSFLNTHPDVRAVVAKD